MYAQLCKQVCKHSCLLEQKDPSKNKDESCKQVGKQSNLLEQKDSSKNKDEPCKFRVLLLNMCKKEFENRSKANEAFDQYGSNISSEDEERRQIAKHKMLGNIKFIGELAKLEILSDGILHSCIQTLLEGIVRGKYKYAADHCEDFECLSQILRTCGRILDNKGHLLMDQYFKHISSFANNTALPPRIRFMLQDVIELRRDNWVPRKAATVEGPMPINQIRPIDDDTRAGYIRDRRGERNNLDRDFSDRQGGGNELFRHPMKTRSGLDDMLIGFNWGSPSAPLIPTHDKFASYNPNGFGGGGRDQGYNNQLGGNYNNYNNRRGGGGGGGGYNKHNQNNMSHNSQFNNSSNKEVAPRFKKNLILATQSTQGIGDLELRPAANSMLFKQTIIKSNQLPLANRTIDQVPPSITPPMIQTSTVTKPLTILNKEPPLIIKQPSVDKQKQSKKDKGPNKEEVLKKLSTLLEEYIKSESNAALSEAVSAYKEHKVPEKFSKDAVLTMFNAVIDKTDSDKKSVVSLIAALRKESLLPSTACYDGLKALCNSIPERETELPRITSLVAAIAAQGVISSLITLADVATITENGTHYPLFLLVLQQINKLQGRAELTQVFNESKVNLLTQLPESERTKERLAEILEDRCLTFLFPLLKIQAELSKQLQADPNPQQFYKWIKDNLETSCHTDHGFINALMTVLLKYITQESTLPEGADPSVIPDKLLIEKEAKLLERYKLVLKAFLHGRSDLQVVAIYSLQVYCYSHQFPKGMLLRWFVALYEFEVIEEEAYLRWKEDVTDAYPGKGNALFQVNAWLMWLQTADTEDDESDE